jgi:hypothetical protein
MHKASEFERFKRIEKKLDESIERYSKKGDQARGFRAIRRKIALERRGLRGPALRGPSSVSTYSDF